MTRTGILWFLATTAFLFGPLGAGAQEIRPGHFVKVDGLRFELDGRAFRIAGINNHYLAFGSEEEVKHVLDDAVAMGANTVRTFIQPVIGSADGSVATIWNSQSTAESSNLGTHGVYMMSWDPTASKMVVNDGPDGLQRIDFLLDEARKRNLRLVIAFVDFWAYTGGAQQMRAWYGSEDKYTFFAEDPRVRQDYKDFVRHVLTRVNTVNGIPYADDPTVFAWELANEPDIHPEALLKDWLTEMSAYVKELAPKQLLTTGHGNIVAKLDDMAIPSVDYGTWHGYASYLKITPAQFDDMIQEYCGLARRHGKPLVLEEFGLPRSDPSQAEAYRTWLTTLESEPGCGNWMIWRLTSLQDHGGYPVDEHDRFDVHADGSETWNVLREAAGRARQAFNQSPATPGG